jgi:hypothetical protein
MDLRSDGRGKSRSLSAIYSVGSPPSTVVWVGTGRWDISGTKGKNCRYRIPIALQHFHGESRYRSVRARGRGGGGLGCSGLAVPWRWNQGLAEDEEHHRCLFGCQGSARQGRDQLDGIDRKNTTTTAKRNSGKDRQRLQNLGVNRAWLRGLPPSPFEWRSPRRGQGSEAGLVFCNKLCQSGPPRRSEWSQIPQESQPGN